MQTVLVTGAGGYIGTVLVPLLLAHGHRVVALDRFFFGSDLLPAPDAADGRLTVVRDDTRCLTPAHFRDVDAVIDLAAISNDPSGERFQDATWAINHRARARAAALAKQAGVGRYILPSSCAIYGRLDGAGPADETAPTHPLTTYARANECAEGDALALADESFTVIVLRQATVFGLSPRMRFDLAINGMTHGAVVDRRLPVMRDGTQWRPMLHVRDAASAHLFMLDAPAAAVNGRIFNVGSAGATYRIGDLGRLVADTVPGPVEIAWYGDPDHRSYRVAFERIEALGWYARFGAEEGVREIAEALAAGLVTRTLRTITLDWYTDLMRHPERHADLALYGGLIDITIPPGIEPPDAAARG